MTTGWASIVVEVAFTSPAGTFSPTWTDITADVDTIEISRGRDSEFEDFPAGELKLTIDDTSGNYNPLNASGSHYGNLIAFRQVRVTANNSSSTNRGMFRGHVIPRGWQHKPDLPRSAHTELEALDIMQLVGRVKLPLIAESGPYTSSGEPVAVMFVAGIDIAWQDTLEADGYPRTMASTTLDVNALDHLRLLSESEGGRLFVNRDGVLTFETRANPFFDSTRLTVQGTFDDTGAASTVLFDEIEIDEPADIVNHARYSRPDGEVQEVTDATSTADITTVGIVDEKLDLLLESDPDCYSLAEYVVALRKDGTPSPRKIVFDVMQSNDALNMALNLDIGYRVRVKYTPTTPSGASQTTTDCFIEKIEHSIPINSDARTWTCTFGLSPCAPFDAMVAAGDPWVWDSSTWDGGDVWVP